MHLSLWVETHTYLHMYNSSVCLFICETGFLCVDLTALEFALWARLALNSVEICLPLPLTCGIKGLSHHHLLYA